MPQSYMMYEGFFNHSGNAATFLPDILAHLQYFESNVLSSVEELCAYSWLTIIGHAACVLPAMPFLEILGLPENTKFAKAKQETPRDEDYGWTMHDLKQAGATDKYRAQFEFEHKHTRTQRLLTESVAKKPWWVEISLADSQDEA